MDGTKVRPLLWNVLEKILYQKKEGLLFSLSETHKGLAFLKLTLLYFCLVFIHELLHYPL